MWQRKRPLARPSGPVGRGDLHPAAFCRKDAKGAKDALPAARPAGPAAGCRGGSPIQCHATAIPAAKAGRLASCKTARRARGGVTWSRRSWRGPRGGGAPPGCCCTSCRPPGSRAAGTDRITIVIFRTAGRAVSQEAEEQAVCCRAWCSRPCCRPRCRPAWVTRLEVGGATRRDAALRGPAGLCSSSSPPLPS